MHKLTFLAAAASMLFGVNATAGTYPSRPIVMIAPFAAGGPADALVRVLAERMRWGFGPTVLDRFAAAVPTASADAEGRTRLAHLGQDIPTAVEPTPVGLNADQSAEIEKWRPVVEAAKISAS